MVTHFQVELKRKALLEEARDFFGYSIDPRDPRFLEMQVWMRYFIVEKLH